MQAMTHLETAGGRPFQLLTFEHLHPHPHAQDLRFNSKRESINKMEFDLRLFDRASSRTKVMIPAILALFWLSVVI